jgi:hypothetical protein
MADEGEAVPNIDWGQAELPETAKHFAFSRLPDRSDVLGLAITTKEGREIKLAITRNAIIGLENTCREVRRKLGF